MSKEHKKHTNLTKPIGGYFHRNEFAVLGAPCSRILTLCQDIARRLSNERVGFVDADHKEESRDNSFSKYYTDKISHHSLQWDHEELKMRFRSLFDDEDMVLVNGNHFEAKTQIVLINQQKKESLSRKLDRLTNVILVILDEGGKEVYPFLTDHIGPDVPVVRMDEPEKIVQTLQHHLNGQRPHLNGLVFAGGESVRMGFDKGGIDYHGRPQREVVADLLGDFTRATYLSVQDADSFESHHPKLVDSFRGLGPYGGLLSAFREDPNAAWLAVACDIPLLDRKIISQLVDNRKYSRLATCFHNPETGFPEPLITIWEPRAYPVLLRFLGQGYSCPRKVLINSGVHELDISDPGALQNVNTPEQLDEVMKKIKGSGVAT